MARQKVIITCAVTGSVHTPTMSPYLPVTPDEIAAEAIAAAEAGASIVHLHARDPENGRPSADPDVFMQFLPRIKQATDAVINISTGGSSLMALDDRLADALRAEPEMCSLNMGSMNFGLYPALDRYTEWKHAWEPQLLEATRNSIFRNTFADIESYPGAAWWRGAVRVSSSNVTTSAISIRWRISVTGVLSRARCSSSLSSACSEGSAPIRRTSPT